MNLDKNGQVLEAGDLVFLAQAQRKCEHPGLYVVTRFGLIAPYLCPITHVIGTECSKFHNSAWAYAKDLVKVASYPSTFEICQKINEQLAVPSQ